MGGQAHAYTSSIRASAGCSMRTVSALSRSTTLSESARMTSTVGRLRDDRWRLLVAAGRDDEDPAGGADRGEDADQVAGLDRLEPERRR